MRKKTLFIVSMVCLCLSSSKVSGSTMVTPLTAETVVPGNYFIQLAALNSSQDIATANNALSGLGGWLNNAKMSQYSSNSGVLSLMGPAQTSYNALDAKLKLIPTFVMVSALNTAFNDYSKALEALVFVNDLTIFRKKVDDSLASLGIAVNDAKRLYQEARALIPAA